MARVAGNDKVKWLERTKHDESNRAGMPSARVKGRRRRQARWHTDDHTGMPTKPVGMDMLRVGTHEDGTPKYVDNTGSYGFRTSYGTYLSILAYTPGVKGKVRARQGGKGRGAKRVNRYRNPGATCSPKLSMREYWNNKVNSVIHARNLLMKARTIENIADGAIALLTRWQSQALDALNEWLDKELTAPKRREIETADMHRFKCLAGEYKAGDLRSDRLVKLTKEIDRAVWLVSN